MSEPRYPGRVSDPDETTRIPKDALDELRDTDHSWEQGSSGSAPSSGPAGSSAPTGPEPSQGGNGSSASPSTSGGFRNGSSGLPGIGSEAPAGPAPRPGPPSGSTPGVGPGLNGYSSDGSPAVPPGGSDGSGGSDLTAPYGGSDLTAPYGGSTTRGSLGSAGSLGSSPAGPAGGYGQAGGFGPSGSGYSGRSETGYSPASYPSSYSSGYPSLGEPPTTVTGPPGPPGMGAGPGPGAAAAARSALGTAARPTARGGPSGSRPARRARLLVRHIDPWSTLKFSFVLSVAMFFVWLVAVGVLYGVLDGMGVFEQINSLYDEVAENSGERLFSPGLVLGAATLIGAVNIVLFTALATIGAFVYNICADLVGGIEVTLAERD